MKSIKKRVHMHWSYVAVMVCVMGILLLLLVNAFLRTLQLSASIGIQPVQYPDDDYHVVSRIFNTLEGHRHMLPPGSLVLLIDCGSRDGIYIVTPASEFIRLNIARPGQRFKSGLDGRTHIYQAGSMMIVVENNDADVHINFERMTLRRTDAMLHSTVLRITIDESLVTFSNATNGDWRIMVHGSMDIVVPAHQLREAMLVKPCYNMFQLVAII